MVKTWDIAIPELTGREKRRAYLYLPVSYRKAPGRRYPVLYMFDGHNVFFDSHATYGKCWGMKEYMDSTATEVIVAAVECNHSPDHGRLKEYSPFSFTDPYWGEIEGRGQITMDWMVNTFKPYIDRHFRTLPGREYTWIAGSSMGGLMSLYAVLKYNQVFSRAAALSPSLWTDMDGIEEMIDGADLMPDTILYMDYGSEELGNHRGMLRQFGAVASELMRKGVMLNCRLVPGGSHCEASWERQIPFFMSTLMYSLPEPENRGKTSRKKETKDGDSV